MTIAVTGACGALGKNLSASLARRGHRVRRIDRSPCESQTDLQQLDITEYEPLVKAFEEADSVVHLAGIPVPSESFPGELYVTNVYGSYLVYLAASQAGVRNVVAASSINALGFYFGVVPQIPLRLPLSEEHPRWPTDPYSFSKKSVEEIAEYFSARDGIGGAALRIPITFDARERENNIERYRRIRSLVRNAMADTTGEWLSRFRQSVERYRLDRARERGIDPSNYFADGEAALLAWVYGFFVTLEIEDLADAVEKLCGLTTFGGCPFIGSSYNYLGIDAGKLAEFFFPGVPRAGLTGGPTGLVSTTLLRSLINWKPVNTDTELQQSWNLLED